MKAYDLQPTDENLIETLKKDAIGRNESIFDFISILNSLEGCFSIGIDGPWGSGKTFFVKQTKLILEALNPYSNMVTESRDVINTCLNHYMQNDLLERKDLVNQVPVYYDAWFNDNETDPLLSLLATIVNEFDTIEDFKKYLIDKELLTTTASKLLNINFLSTFKSVDMLKDIKENRVFYDEATKMLDSVLEERGDRLVIFIDELDRCCPQFAVKLLERVKHYFNNDRITFVFSINTEQLQYTIKNFYGEGFNASRYLDRFFDIRISIPKYNFDNFCRHYNFGDNSIYSEINSQIIKTFNFQMREISKFLRIVKVATGKIVDENKFVLNDHYEKIFVLTTIVPVLIGTKIYDATSYENFSSGKDSSILFKIFNDLENNTIVLSELLSSNEYFKDTQKPNFDDATEVTIEDKLNEFYDAVFNFNRVAGYNGCYKIGKLRFYKDLSQYVLNMSNLLSKECNINEDLC